MEKIVVDSQMSTLKKEIFEAEEELLRLAKVH